MQRVHPALVPLALVVGLLACAAPAAPTPAAAPSPAGAAASGAPTAAAVAPTSAPAARPAPVTLKVGDLRINSSAGTYIALERGYFAEQGITLDFEPFTTGGEQIPPLANGQLDIGVGAVSAALYNAVGRGVPIKLVVDQGRHVPGRTATAFVVRTDLWESGAIREPADLRGRPIGISSTASTPEILVDRALQRGGLTIRDVNLTVLPFPEMQAAFANRAIDGAAYQEPFTTRGVENGLVVRWFHADEYYPQQQNGVLMFGPNLVANTEAARGYILAYLRGVREYNAAFLQGERREEVIQILIQHTTIKDRDLYDKMAPSGLGPNGDLIKKTLKIYPYLPGGYGTSIGSALQGNATLARTPDHKLDWAFLRPEEPAKFFEGTRKVVNTVPPNDFSYFELINDLVQKEPVGALDPEIMGSLAAIGIVKGKPFNPDARMKKILTDAAAIGTAAARTVDWRPRPGEGFFYYPNSAWTEPLFVGGYNFETPPPEVSATGAITVNPPTGARTLNARTSFFFCATYITPAMSMRLTGIGSQYLGAFVDSNGEYFDGGKTYKMTLPPNVPAEKFWSLTLYDNQTRSMLDTPQRYPRAGSQSYPTPAAAPNPDGSTTVYFGPSKPPGVTDGNWIQTAPGKGWSTLLRLYSPLEPFFTKTWRPSEIELVR